MLDKLYKHRATVATALAEINCLAFNLIVTQWSEVQMYCDTLRPCFDFRVALSTGDLPLTVTLSLMVETLKDVRQIKRILQVKRLSQRERLLTQPCLVEAQTLSLNSQLHL